MRGWTGGGRSEREISLGGIAGWRISSSGILGGIGGTSTHSETCL